MGEGLCVRSGLRRGGEGGRVGKHQALQKNYFCIIWEKSRPPWVNGGGSLTAATGIFALEQIKVPSLPMGLLAIHKNWGASFPLRLINLMSAFDPKRT